MDNSPSNLNLVVYVHCSLEIAQYHRLAHVKIGLSSYHLPCKHFFAVFRFKAEWTWDRLPKNYLNSPRLSCDIDVLELKDEGEVGPASEHINPHCQLPHPIFEQISDELTSNELQSDSELIDSSSDTSIEVSFFVYW